MLKFIKRHYLGLVLESLTPSSFLCVEFNKLGIGKLFLKEELKIIKELTKQGTAGNALFYRDYCEDKHFSVLSSYELKYLMRREVVYSLIHLLGSKRSFSAKVFLIQQQIRMAIELEYRLRTNTLLKEKIEDEQIS